MGRGRVVGRKFLFRNGDPGHRSTVVTFITRQVASAYPLFSYTHGQANAISCAHSVRRIAIAMKTGAKFAQIQRSRPAEDFASLLSDPWGGPFARPKFKDRVGHDLTLPTRHRQPATARSTQQHSLNPPFRTHFGIALTEIMGHPGFESGARISTYFHVHNRADRASGARNFLDRRQLSVSFTEVAF